MARFPAGADQGNRIWKNDVAAGWGMDSGVGSLMEEPMSWLITILAGAGSADGERHAARFAGHPDDCADGLDLRL